MKAIICNKYGSPDVLQFKEVEKPVPKENDALVKVHATSVNTADLEILRGMWFARLGGPIRPMHKILGSDLAGQIEAIGANVKQFQPGDEIWGDLSEQGLGTFAEYVCVPENALRLKPPSMTFEEAASIPTAAIVALQCLIAKGPLKPGQAASFVSSSPMQPERKILINGAGGSVGTFAVQIAKHFGAEVTGVDSTVKLEMLRSIGADHVIDYTREDFTKCGQCYDLILDVVANHSIFAIKNALCPMGIYISTGSSLAAVSQNLLLGSLISMAGSKKMGVGPWNPNKKEDLDFMEELFEAGKVIPVIDKRYPLSEVPEALRYLKAGHAKGKVVITI